MATPTPGKHPHGAVATPPVSTPFSRPASASASHLAAFSPRGTTTTGTSAGAGAGTGTRSVLPSPQAQFKKASPANSNTVYGHPTSSSFGAMNFDSPSAAAALGVLPSLGDLGLDGAAGGLAVPVGGMHGLGGRADEDEKRKKLQQVIDILKTNKGRISEEGIERLASRVGLECLWVDQMGSSGGSRTLIIAGTGFSLDIDFKNNAVTKVSLSFPESPEVVTKHGRKAGEVLLQDLQIRPGESALTKTLDRFAVNLERLAAVDKFSCFPNLNCHEAIAGVYESLSRLHEWEVARLKDENAMAGRSSDYIRKTALCNKSGQPVMNARGNVGPRLEYWQEKHLITKRSKTKSAGMDENNEPRTWSLTIECAASPALVYPSVRVSDNWISADIQKASPTAGDLLMATAGPVLDWQEPDNILLPATEPKTDGPMDGMDHDSNTKMPDVMFIVKFNPPLVVPYSVAGQIYNSTGATLEFYQPSTFDGLLFPPKPDEKHETDMPYHRRIERRQSVMVTEKIGGRHLKNHKNILTIQKLEYGRVMTELPFSHPRQLVDLLPVLRQYACLTSILDRAFSNSHTDDVGAPSTLSEENGSPAHLTVHDEYEAFLSEGLSQHRTSLHLDVLPIEVILYTQPHPCLRLTFPFSNRTADIQFEVGTNGALTVTAQNVLPVQEADAKREAESGMSTDVEMNRRLTEADLARALEISEHLGLFVEFVRSRLG